MNEFHAFLFGAIQGVTEYLPISSSAHLILLPRFLGISDPGLTFDVFLHLGTLFATLVYFWKEWAKLLQAKSWQSPSGKLLLAIGLATIPALACGALLHRWVETVFRGNSVLVVTLSVGGVVLFGVDHFLARSRKLEGLGLKDALWIGVAQCVALVPGISRSGATITGARLLGFDRATAARFSFLISAPVTAAAVIFEFRKFDVLFAEMSGGGSAGLGSLIIAGLSSFVFGMITIGFLLRWVQKFSLLSFAVYRVILAVVIWRVLGTGLEG